jgi:hypothetical protein
MSDDDSLRRFLARMLGWTNAPAVAHALRSVELAVVHHTQLVLCGDGDLVPIAYALHQRTIGADRPFVVCDPRRRDAPASVRSPANHGTGIAAVEAARDGSLCVRSLRLPLDFSSAMARIRDPGARVQFVICADRRDADDVLLAVPAPITIPPLETRTSELSRIVDEYALDAISTLGARRGGFTEEDRAWVIDHEASSLSEIETATLRLVALRTSANMSNAAARLGMAPVSLSRWIGRREIPQVYGAGSAKRSGRDCGRSAGRSSRR